MVMSKLHVVANDVKRSAHIVTKAFYSNVKWWWHFHKT